MCKEKKIKTILNIKFTYCQKMSGLELARTGARLRNWQLVFAVQQILEIYQSDILENPFISLSIFLILVQKWFIYQLCNHFFCASASIYGFQLRLPEGSSFLFHIKISIATTTFDLEHPENSCLVSTATGMGCKLRIVRKAPSRHACRRLLLSGISSASLSENLNFSRAGLQ